MPPAQTSSGSEEKGGASDGAGGTTPPNVSHDALRSVCLMKAGLHSCGPIDTGRPCFISNAPPPADSRRGGTRVLGTCPIGPAKHSSSQPLQRGEGTSRRGVLPPQQQMQPKETLPGGPGGHQPCATVCGWFSESHHHFHGSEEAVTLAAHRPF